MSDIETVYPIQLADKTGLVCINRAELKDVLLSAGALDPLVECIRGVATNLVADALTPEGRKQRREMGERVKSYARDLDKYRKAVVDVLKEEPKTIDANVREARKAIEAIEAEVMAPVREIDARADKLRIMADRPNIITAMDAKGLAVELAQAEAMDVSERIWHEATETAVAVKDGLIDALETMLDARRDHERQVAELEAFKAHKAEEARLREIAEAREQGRREEAEARAVAEAQRKAEAVTATVAEIVAPVKVAPITHDDDFDSDHHKIDRYLMRIQAVTVPVLRDSGNQSRIASIINRAVSAIKGV